MKKKDLISSFLSNPILVIVIITFLNSCIISLLGVIGYNTALKEEIQYSYITKPDILANIFYSLILTSITYTCYSITIYLFHKLKNTKLLYLGLYAMAINILIIVLFNRLVSSFNDMVSLKAIIRVLLVSCSSFLIPYLNYFCMNRYKKFDKQN